MVSLTQAFNRFGSWKSLLQLAIGSALMLPYSYDETYYPSIDVSSKTQFLSRFHEPPALTAAVLLGTLLVIGYMTRVMRAELRGATELPTWLANPVDIIVSPIANVVGLLVMSLAAGVVWGVVAILVATRTIPDDYSFVAIAVTAVLSLPLLAFAPMMAAHYANEGGRFSAVCELRTIYRKAAGNFIKLWGLFIVAAIMFILPTVAASAFWPLEAVVSFFSLTLIAILIAQIYQGNAAPAQA